LAWPTSLSSRSERQNWSLGLAITGLKCDGHGVPSNGPHGPTEQSGDQSEIDAEMRHSVLDERAQDADLRQRHADRRQALADQRDDLVAERLVAMHRRDELADARDHLADRRQAMADERERLADQREVDREVRRSQRRGCDGWVMPE
jgi:hypothetical protein